MARKQKENKKSEKEVEPKATRANTERQIKIFLVLLVTVTIIIFIVIALKQSSRTFDYNGLSFTKDKMGAILFYTVKIPIEDAYGNIKSYLLIDFRNDPRKLENIEVNTTGNIKFVQNNKVYVSINEPIKQCNYTGIAMINLGRFLTDVSLDVKGAINNASYSNSTDFPYVNCDNTKNSTVVMIRSSNQTGIFQKSKSCYEITFKDCEILQATEKFELTILEQYFGTKSNTI